MKRALFALVLIIGCKASRKQITRYGEGRSVIYRSPGKRLKETRDVLSTGDTLVMNSDTVYILPLKKHLSRPS